MKMRYTFLLRPLKDEGAAVSFDTATVVASSAAEARAKAESLLRDDGKDVGALWQVEPAA